MYFQNIYKKLSTPEKNGKTIGLFRALCAIFGGLIVAYSSMTLITMLTPIPAQESIMIPLMFNTLVWALIALWISISPTKLSALLRSVVPSIIFIVSIAYLY